MKNILNINSNKPQDEKMRGYYRFHARIYDATRWLFLFGRNEIIDCLPFASNDFLTIIEVGCGTGTNLLNLAKRYPNAHFIGIDVSMDMLSKTEKKLSQAGVSFTLHYRPYGAADFELPQADIILFSYCLTMVNPDWQILLERAVIDLKPMGNLAFVDFHGTRWQWFRRWMQVNHVEMTGVHLTFLQKILPKNRFAVKKAYGGLWEYFWFLGEN